MSTASERPPGENRSLGEDRSPSEDRSHRADQSPREDQPTHIPVILLTGFLGTGKTTLLRAALREPSLAATAVLINEIGEVGLDHLIVFGAGAAPTGDAGAALRSALLLDNGCVCCTVRDELALALDDLLVRAAAGDIPGFDRVIIETTGLADPVPVIESLNASPLTASRYALERVICTVDAAAPIDRYTRHRESLAQIVCADDLIITRSDLSDSVRIEALERALGQWNRQACIHGARPGLLAELCARRPLDPQGAIAQQTLPIFAPGTAVVLDALGDEDLIAAAEAPAEGRILATSFPMTARHFLKDSNTLAANGGLARRGSIRALNHARVQTNTVRFSGPSVWSKALEMIEASIAEDAHEVLRVKGVLRLSGFEHPMLVQYAGARISPLEPLPGALADGDAGYLVIIRAVN